MQELFKVFESLGLPYFRQGSLSDEEYPKSFFTFWNYDSPELSFYDNGCKRSAEFIQVCFYTCDANLIYSVMDEFIAAAKAAGFETSGRALDTNADKENYFGRLVNIKKLHTN